jgi:hypothetical protein
MVAVDGHKAMLPAPESPANLVISRLQYKIAEISDLHGTLDEYLGRSGITVEDA